jgi:hypothetical protein
LIDILVSGTERVFALYVSVSDEGDQVSALQGVAGED